MNKYPYMLAIQLAILLPGVAAAQAVTPLPIVAEFEAREASPPTTKEGRKITTFEHAMNPAWGYGADAPVGRFIVVEPAKATERPPMIVLLHGSGGTAKPHMVKEPEFLTLSLDCAPCNGPPYEGWYGRRWMDEKGWAKFVHGYSPPEHRYLAEILWVARKYQVDPDRIYLTGMSMGGSGSLGLGMARGDLFAAMMITVPAATEHVFFRMGFPERTAVERKPTTAPAATPAARPTGPTLQMTRTADYLARVSARTRPDAPPIINITSHIDGWSENQENLIEACHDGRHLMIFTWAPFGHTSGYAETDPAVQEFPWLSIRRNEAYPVFTDATSDQVYPGRYVTDRGDQQGQINGYFRWKAKEDAERRWTMELWLVTATSLTTTRPMTIPESATVDISPRRLQKFVVMAGTAYRWSLLEGNRTHQSGEVSADELGLLTIPRVTVTASPRTLTVERLP